jgi:hypothetical protein
MGSVCKNGFLRACEIQFSESRQEGVSHLNIALFSSVMRRGSSFEGLVWLSALFFVQRDARQSRSFIVEWLGMPSLFRSASAFGASIPEPTLTRRGGTTNGQTAFARLGCLARKYGRMCVSALRLASWGQCESSWGQCAKMVFRLPRAGRNVAGHEGTTQRAEESAFSPCALSRCERLWRRKIGSGGHRIDGFGGSGSVGTGGLRG